VVDRETVRVVDGATGVVAKKDAERLWRRERPIVTFGPVPEPQPPGKVNCTWLAPPFS